MHGELSLESTLGLGTKATFWIPFRKPQFHDGSSPLVDMDALPDLLQSEMSVSCSSSDFDHLGGTPPPVSPLNQAKSSKNRPRTLSVVTPPNAEPELAMAERGKVEVLVVEDNAINQQIAVRSSFPRLLSTSLIPDPAQNY